MNKKNKSKKTCKFVKILLCIGVIYSATVGVFKIIEMIKTKRFNKKNQGSPVKQYYSFMNSKRILPYDGCVDGIVATSLFSSINIDLTDTCLKEDAFISINGLCSAIKIEVPSDVTVICDGYIKASALNNQAEEGPETNKKLYVVAKLKCCAVDIKRA